MNLDDTKQRILMEEDHHKVQQILLKWRSALLPPPNLTVSEWADRERRLSPEASAEPGQWVTARAEYQRGIMDAYKDPEIRHIVVKKSAQVGWTEILNNIIGYIIDQNPGPVLLLQPTLEMAQAWSKDRLATMLRDTPAIRGKVKDAKSRDSGNTILHKTFPGGHITIAGANSPVSLASRPIRDVLCDETDRYPASAGAEGDPISLATKRTTTFYNRKLLEGSTPTIKGASRIDQSWEESDKRYYYVPCTHCGEAQVLKWANVKWGKDERGDHLPESAHYVCEHCGVCLSEADKHKMVLKGEWRATAPFKGIAGFHICELYSPWSTWARMVADFLIARKQPETLKTWVNTSLGETWEESGEKLDPNDLLNRREPYGETLPAGVVLLTAGVDVQRDRLECEVVGWGQEDESWSIRYRTFYGNPVFSDVWNDLDAFLGQHFEHESGLKLKIAAVFVDSGGHHTDAVYKFTKARQHRRIYAIKGSSTPGSPAVGRPSKKNKGNTLLFPIGTDTIKETIYSGLKITDPGPAYCHFSNNPVVGNDAEYFNQLTAEEVKTKYRNGHAVRVWEKRPGDRNEALDCRVYATAAKEMLNPNYRKLAQMLEEKAEPLRNVKPDPREDALIEKPAPKPGKKAKRRGGFINRWRH